MEYAIAKVYFLGNDDVNFQGFTARKVDSLKDWEKQVEERVKGEFEDSGYIDISHSDNCSTPFESAEEVLNTIKFSKILEDEFNALSKTLGRGSDEYVQYGNDIGFLDYESPTPKQSKKLKR